MDFKGAWEGAKRVDNWLDPFDVAAAGAANAIEFLIPQTKEEMALELVTLGQGKRLALGGKLARIAGNKTYDATKSLFIKPPNNPPTALATVATDLGTVIRQVSPGPKNGASHVVENGAKPLQISANYSPNRVFVEEGVSKTARNQLWSHEQLKRVRKAIDRRDYDAAYNWLSTWAPLDKNVYGNQAFKIPKHTQHHKFAKYASSSYVMRMMELVKAGKADMDDLINLHELARNFDAPIGGGKWAIQNVLSPAHTQGHTVLRTMGLEHQGKGGPFQIISNELSVLNTPEEVADSMVKFIENNSRPGQEIMNKLHQEHLLRFKGLTPKAQHELLLRTTHFQANQQRKELVNLIIE